MKWYWVVDDLTNKSLFIAHVIPEALYDDVMAALEERGMENYTRDELDGPVLFDLPGMIMMSRGYSVVTLDGQDIKIPYTDFSYFLAKLKELEVRDEIGQPYYKLHDRWRRCLCLTPQQRDDMIATMEAGLQEAEAMREIENARFNEAMSGPEVAQAEPGESASEALGRAASKGHSPKVVVAKRPTKYKKIPEA